MYREVLAYVVRVGLLLAVVQVASACGGGSGQEDENKANEMPSAGKATQTLRIRDTDQFMAVGAGSLWMPNGDHGTITRVDLAKSKVVALIEVNSNPKSAPAETDPQSVAAEGDKIWFTDRAKEAVSRIDPKTNRIVERIPVGMAAYDIAVDGDTLWATDLENDVVVRADASNNRVVKKIEIPAPAAIAVGGGSIWVVEFGAVSNKPSKVARIDPQTNEVVEEIPIMSRYPQHIAFGAGSIWIANGTGDTSVSRVNPQTKKEIARIETGLEMFGLAIGKGSVWAAGNTENCASTKEGALVRIDPTTNKIVGRTNIRCAFGVAMADDALWVYSWIVPAEGLHLRFSAAAALTRVEPAR